MTVDIIDLHFLLFLDQFLDVSLTNFLLGPIYGVHIRRLLNEGFYLVEDIDSTRKD